MYFDELERCWKYEDQLASTQNLLNGSFLVSRLAFYLFFSLFHCETCALTTKTQTSLIEWMEDQWRLFNNEFGALCSATTAS